ncbi:MAG: hypothetical protein K1X36_09905 [Pyrinomonadaceae bacterium]|nr:hypothetical protein [Pyrinomonadaceae bacterium]
MLRNLTILSLAILLIENAYLAGVYEGHVIGAQLGGIYFPNAGGFYLSHADPYFYLANYHIYLVWVYLLSLLLQVVSVKKWPQIFSCAIAFIGLLASFYLVYFGDAHRSDSSTYLDLVRNTRNIDFLILGVSLINFSLQTVYLYSSRQYSNQVNL